MNLRWNPSICRFEAEFSSDFQGDLAAVKGAGFKTTGAPEWIWYAVNTIPLTKLKETRPASGLTINPDAKIEYNRLAEIDKRNADVRIQLAAAKKELKKKADKEKREADLREVVIPEKGYIDASDLPPMPPLAKTYTPPPPPKELCIICAVPVYSYEYAPGAPIVCLWDQKIVLDNDNQVC